MDFSAAKVHRIDMSTVSAEIGIVASPLKGKRVLVY